MGRVVDAESGLVYLRARYYDPNTTQFLSRDPLVATTRSAYGYVGDSPLNGADPSGKDFLPGSGGGGLSGGYTPEGVDNPADALIASGAQVSGQFPQTSSPGSVLYRANGAGEVTNYQVYGSDGQPLYRVDLVGSSHGGIDTPHVQEFTRNTNPETGQTFVNKGEVREASPDEVPSNAASNPTELGPSTGCLASYGPGCGGGPDIFGGGGDEGGDGVVIDPEVYIGGSSCGDRRFF